MIAERPRMLAKAGPYFDKSQVRSVQGMPSSFSWHAVIDVEVWNGMIEGCALDVSDLRGQERPRISGMQPRRERRGGGGDMSGREEEQGKHATCAHCSAQRSGGARGAVGVGRR
eukprot:1365858-Rhodomonas_salina.2